MDFNFWRKPLTHQHAYVLCNIGRKFYLFKTTLPSRAGRCSKKWLEHNYNEYEFNLYIAHVDSFTIENFNFSGPTTLTVTQDGPSYRIELEFGNSCKVMCNAQNITIANIKAYHNDGAA